MTSPPRVVAQVGCSRRGPELLTLPFPDPAEAAPAPQQEPAPDRRLRALLRDLGDQVQRGEGGGEVPALPLATGIPELDRVLGGGFPIGRVSELGGPASSGRTSLGLALLARATASGEFVAWIDWADAFDPVSAEAAGVDLERVLWVRPTDLDAALRSADQVLKAGGFALVGMDLARIGETGSERPRIAASAWPRLRKAAAAAGAALIVLTESRVVGAAADLALELGTARPRFAETPDWLEGLDTRVALVRNRTGPGDGCAPVKFRAARHAA